LESRLSQLLNESSSDHVICFIDLDYFKTVNDTAGHRAGDELLVQLSQYLQSHVRKTDLLSRVGGDEFIVLLEQCNLEQAERLVTLLHHAINRFRFQWKNQVFRVGASIGLNLIEQDCRLSIQEIISEADSACYQAKNGGGNRIEVHVREYHDHSGNLSGADNREHLEHALAENHFRLFSQPIVHANGKSHGCEVLVRLQDGDRLRGASEFMPSLMHYEMLSRLDGWVIHTTMDWMQRHPALVSGYEFVSLNLSAQSLRDKTFIHALFQRLEEQPDIAAKLCFEVSESDAIASIEAAVPFFQKARNLGSRFALDNFGKGFSSLAYLRNLPISFIKIDGFFVTGIADDPVNKDMLSSIQQLASIFKIRTIAKCVENAEIANQAREAGVDYLQGHFSGEIEPFVTSSDFYDNVTGLMAG
jgi:diguanylate cyclase (GGDEF)-like protein